jgi:hypothetical protein
MLFAAVPRRERHATKSILDVGVERLGDLLGAVLLGAISWLISPDSTTVVLVFAAGLGLAGFSVSRRLRGGYVQALEKSLLARTISATRATLDHTFGVNPGKAIRNAATTVRERSVVKSAVPDLPVQLMQDLRSSDPEVVRSVLRRQPLDTVLAPSIIPLLAWDSVLPDASAALKGMGSRITGQLVDALVDPEQQFVVRRRLPRVLGELNSQLAADGLIQALSDERFEVRFHAARALTQIKSRNPHVVIRRETITEVVEREVPNGFREPCPELAVDHVFGLLELVYPREAFHAAHRALKSGDDHLRRTSLEYLENVLPTSLWQRMLPLFEEEATLEAAV